MVKYFDGYITEVYELLQKASITNLQNTKIDHNKGQEVIIDKFKQIKDNEKTIFFAGNGASCSMAEHMSHDFFQNAGINTLTCAETSHITAVSNDLSYDMVFAYRIGRVLKEDDAIITISSSGNSPNIIKAIEAAREKGVFIITLSAMKKDNKSRQMGDINIYVPAPTYGLAESSHAVILHMLLDSYLDKYEGGRH